ncbi:MAG: hypothetical protein MUF86_12820, partial [Akkermansiaceae bacterium]|nr:hypothetical protein [Akkermansiaceae bacterium]
MIDPAVESGELDDGLTSTESKSSPRPPQFRRKFFRVLLVAALVGGGLWLNGPGLRWLAPVIAGHFLEKAGLRGAFTLEGSLTGGLTLRDLKLESDGALARLTLDRARPLYQMRGLLSGRIRGIEIDGLHADLRLGLEKPDAAGEKPAFDPEAFAASLRKARGHLIPLSLDMRNVSLRATRDDAMVFMLAPSRLRHGPGEPVFELDLAEVTTGDGRVWPAQQTRITWNTDSLALDRLDPWPGVGLRELAVSLPEDGAFAADAQLRMNDAVFVISASSGNGSLTADLREGRLDSRWIAENFAIEIPASAELSSFSLNVENLLPAPSRATGAARLLLENLSAAGWDASELSLDLALQADRMTLAASGQSSGTAFALDAEAPRPADGGNFKPGELRGTFRVDDLAGLVATLSQRDPDLGLRLPAPQSMADGTFDLSLDGWKPVRAGAVLTLKPALKEEAATLFSKASWQKGAAIQAELETEGAKLNASWQPEQAIYQGTAVFDTLQSARVARWLAVFREPPAGDLVLTGNWRGGGDLGAATHAGSLTLADFRILRDGTPEIAGGGVITYDWPRGFSAENMAVRAGKQSISADAGMADGFLDLRGLRWQDDGVELLTGSARLPLPADFAKWREQMAHEDRPVRIDVQSSVLPLVKLKDWLPAAAGIDPRASGRIRVNVAGTYAKPEADALVEIRNLRATGQPDLPPADVT